MSAVTELGSAMRSEPEQIMEMLLAGDALARKEITQEEYDATTGTTRQMLQNLGGFVMGRNPGSPGGPLMGDEEFMKQLNGMLTPEQQTKLAELTAASTQGASGDGTGPRRGGRMNAPFLNGQVPVMELENLNTSMDGIKKMASAAKLMIEAMGTMRQGNPNFGNFGNPPGGN
jgi:hypothetical protein